MCKGHSACPGAPGAAPVCVLLLPEHSGWGGGGQLGWQDKKDKGGRD